MHLTRKRPEHDDPYDPSLIAFMDELAHLTLDQERKLEVALIGAIYDFAASIKVNAGPPEFQASGVMAACQLASAMASDDRVPENENNGPHSDAARRAVVAGAREIGANERAGLITLLTRMMPAATDQLRAYPADPNALTYWSTITFLLALASGMRGVASEDVVRGLMEVLPRP
jgi:hypothetical protein